MVEKIGHFKDDFASANPIDISKYELNELEIKVIQNISVGHKNAIGLSELCKKINGNERKIRLAIESLRNQGYLILFGQKLKIKSINEEFITVPSGYYFAETQEDVEEFINYMRSRIIAECLILRNIKLAATKKFTRQFGQLPLMG
jgi:hypothetical protein